MFCDIMFVEEAVRQLRWDPQHIPV